MDFILDTADPFIGHPERCFGVAAGFVLLWLLTGPRRSWLLAIPALAWVVFGLWEAKVGPFLWGFDLIAIWPAVLGITFIVLVHWSIAIASARKAGNRA